MRLEGLGDVEQPLGRRHDLRHVARIGVGIAGDEDDVQAGIDGADLLGRIDAVHARRHAHVEEGDGEGAPFGGGALHRADRLLALLAELELVGLVGLLLLVAEQLGLEIVEPGIGQLRLAVGAQDAAVSVQNARLIVRNENAVRHCTHAPSSIPRSRRKARIVRIGAVCKVSLKIPRKTCRSQCVASVVAGGLVKGADRARKVNRRAARR